MLLCIRSGNQGNGSRGRWLNLVWFIASYQREFSILVKRTVLVQDFYIRRNQVNNIEECLALPFKVFC